MKKYIAKPEHIGDHIELPDGSNTSELYNLEDKAHDAINAIIEWRTEHQPLGHTEEYWTQALPQTLRALLDSYDVAASTVAAKSFISEKIEEMIDCD